MFTFVRVAGDHKIGRCEGKFLLPETSFCKSQSGSFFIIKKEKNGQMSFLVFKKPKEDQSCHVIGDLIPRVVESIRNSHEEIIHEKKEPIEMPCMFASREAAKWNADHLNQGKISPLLLDKIKKSKARLEFVPLLQEICLEDFLQKYEGILL